MTILASARRRWEPIRVAHFAGLHYVLGRPETPDETPTNPHEIG
jgi:hypothetical protein